MQVTGTKNGDNSKKELEDTLATLTSLQEEHKLLEENYQLVISERDDIFKELELRKEEVTQLDEEINRLQSNQPDNVKLLATIESDKVAASRAVAQNAELKKQLEEIEQAFIQIVCIVSIICTYAYSKRKDITESDINHHNFVF